MPFRPGTRSPRGDDGISTSRSIRADNRPPLPRALHGTIGACLRSLYAPSLRAQLPRRLLTLVSQLEASSDRPQVLSPDRFRDDLLRLLPDLRRFAHSITQRADQADDLVQETFLRAWQSQDHYRAGTNLKAWTFTIMRNSFYSEKRKLRREVSDVDGAAAGRLVEPADQVHKVALQEVWSRMQTLPETQQEALMLVAAQGMTYEEASTILGCQVGTVKSRVSRARKRFPDSAGLP